jgi:hypothetical protein
MLTFEEKPIEELLQQHQTQRAKNGTSAKGSDSWGCGHIESNFSGLQGAFFRAMGKQDRTPGNYPPAVGDDIKARDTNEFFHPIVRARKAKLSTEYSPAALAGYMAEGPGDGPDISGWQWIKQRLLPVPEYVLRPEKQISVMRHSGYVNRPSLSRSMCPKSILADLDRHNGIPMSAGETNNTQ